MARIRASGSLRLAKHDYADCKASAECRQPALQWSARFIAALQQPGDALSEPFRAVIADVLPEMGEAVAADINAGQGRAMFVRTDVTVEADVRRAEKLRSALVRRDRAGGAAQIWA